MDIAAPIVSEVERLQTLVARLSWNDSLAMYNQAGGLAAIEALEDGTYALVFCDIDHLKALNTATGNHMQTNRYLREGLKVRTGEIAMQYFGDEFLFVLGNTRGCPDPSAFVCRLARQLAQQPLAPAEQSALLRLAGAPTMSATFAWRGDVERSAIRPTIECLSRDVLRQKARRDMQQPPMLRAGEGLLTRAVTQGALLPAEAIALFKRVQG